MKTQEATPGKSDVQRTLPIPVEAHANGAFVVRVPFHIMDDSSKPKWLLDGLSRSDQEIPVSRVTIDIWDALPPWTQDDIFSVVVCVDGEVIGRPLSVEDGCAVFNWLQDALPDLEKSLMDEVERLYEEDMDVAGREVEMSR